MPDKPMSAPEFAKWLGVGPDSVLLWINDGKLRAINTSGGKRPRWKILPEDAAKFLESRASKVKEPVQRRRKAKRIDEGCTQYF